MTTVEDRLTAALAARADLVQVEDLRPPALPDRSKTWVRRPATYLAAAAACAAAVAAPFLIAGDDEAQTGHGPATQPADPDPGASAGEGGDWPVIRTARVDVDGDGIEDEALVRDPRRDFVDQIRIEVVLSSGGSAWIQLREPNIGLRFMPADIDGNGDGELVLADYIGRPAMHVFDLVEGSLVPVDQPDDPPLTSAYTREDPALVAGRGPAVLQPVGGDPGRERPLRPASDRVRGGAVGVVPRARSAGAGGSGDQVRAVRSCGAPLSLRGRLSAR